MVVQNLTSWQKKLLRSHLILWNCKRLQYELCNCLTRTIALKLFAQWTTKPKQTQHGNRKHAKIIKPDRLNRQLAGTKFSVKRKIQFNSNTQLSHQNWSVFVGVLIQNCIVFVGIWKTATIFLRLLFFYLRAFSTSSLEKATNSTSL